LPLSRLNTEQLEAATSSYQHNLIIASAGTGKTSTIVGRIAHLLGQGVKPDEIMLLTFTNKAAAEMVERVAHYFGKEIASRIEAGTFHAISYRWLKRRDKKVVLKQQRELKTLFRSVHEKRVFSHIDATASAYGASYLYDLYMFYQNTELELGFEEWIDLNYPEHEGFAMIYADIVDEFELLKSEYGFLNFNDLLLKFRELCFSEELPYKEVLVDEYQDTNALQGTLLDAMSPPSIFCVGDYDQSIYAFNGADITIIGSFVTKYPDAKVFTLSKNYRSSRSILSLAERVIGHNDRIYPKKLEVTRLSQSVDPRLLIYEELFEQYRGIASIVQRSSTTREEIAIIFRNNSSADGIEVALKELGIACKRRGGSSFFDAREIKAVLDLYTLAVNELDMMAFVHIFDYAKGVGSAVATDLYLALKKLGGGSFYAGLYRPDLSIHNPFEKKKQNHQLGLFDDMLELSSVAKYAKLGFKDEFLQNQVLKHPKLNRESVTFLYQFYNLFASLKSLKRPLDVIKKISLSPLFENISDQLATKRATRKDMSVDEAIKADSLDRISRKMALLSELSLPYDQSERFLNAMILGSSDLTQGSGVNLLSVHASKGLEFEEVFVIDLIDGRFPNRKLMQQSGSLEEERRLFYVATTRAKDLLYLSYAKYDKLKKLNFVPSQFLYEASMLKKDEHYALLVGGE